MTSASRRRIKRSLVVSLLIWALAGGCAQMPRAFTTSSDEQGPSISPTTPKNDGESQNPRTAKEQPTLKDRLLTGARRASHLPLTLASADVAPKIEAAGGAQNAAQPQTPAPPSSDESADNDDDGSDAAMPADEMDQDGGDDSDQAPSAEDNDNSDDAAPEEPQNEEEYLKVLDPSIKVPPKPSPETAPRRRDEPSNEIRRAPLSANDVGLLPGPELKSDRPPAKLHLDDADVRKVLEMLSREHGLNVLVSPNVTGRVTADLSNLTLGEMLNAILKSCDLAARNENGVIYVYTPEEMKERNGRNEDDKVAIRVYRMNYVRSTDVQKILKPFLSPEGKMTATPASQVGVRPINPISGQSASGGGGSSSSGGGGGGGGGGGSAGGGGNQVSVSGGDALATQEAVLIEDRESILRKTDQIIQQLDVQPPQVLIEAVILYVTHNHSSELGVNFGVINGSGEVLGVVGNGAAINAASGFSPASVIANGLLNTPASTGGSGGGSSSSGGTGFGADTPGFKFGNSSKNITSFITALETVGNVEVLATPKLLVLNKQLAELQLGDRLGYSTLSQSIVSTTQQISFMNVGTLLRVRPFISTDGMVRMEVHPERSTGAIVNSIPQASTAEVTTNVLVPDGATLVIGGLMDHQTEIDQTGIPGLDRIPILGALFRDRTRTTTKKELVVLLTTHIMNPRTECLPSGSAAHAALQEIARPLVETLPAP